MALLARGGAIAKTARDRRVTYDFNAGHFGVLLNLLDDRLLAFSGQPVEDVRDLAELFEVQLAQILLVLLLNERVSVGRQDFAQVKPVGLEELAECALLRFVLVREEHLRGQLFVLPRLRLHIFYLALYLLLLVYRAIYLSSNLEVLRRRLSHCKTLRSPFHYL